MPTDSLETSVVLIFEPVKHRREVPSVGTQGVVVVRVPPQLEVRPIGRIVELVNRTVAQQTAQWLFAVVRLEAGPFRGMRNSNDLSLAASFNCKGVPWCLGGKTSPAESKRLLLEDEPVRMRTGKRKAVIAPATLGFQRDFGLHRRRHTAAAMQLIVGAAMPCNELPKPA